MNLDKSKLRDGRYCPRCDKDALQYVYGLPAGAYPGHFVHYCLGQQEVFVSTFSHPRFGQSQAVSRANAEREKA